MAWERVVAGTTLRTGLGPLLCCLPSDAGSSFCQAGADPEAQSTRIFH